MKICSPMVANFTLASFDALKIAFHGYRHCLILSFQFARFWCTRYMCELVRCAGPFTHMLSKKKSLYSNLTILGIYTIIESVAVVLLQDYIFSYYNRSNSMINTLNGIQMHGKSKSFDRSSLYGFYRAFIKSNSFIGISFIQYMIDEIRFEKCNTRP